MLSVEDPPWRNESGEKMKSVSEKIEKISSRKGYSFLLHVLFYSSLILHHSSFSSLAQESICARVKIEIEQGLTLERQAFDARMRINNGSAIAIERVQVDVPRKSNLVRGQSALGVRPIAQVIDGGVVRLEIRGHFFHAHHGRRLLLCGRRRVSLRHHQYPQVPH